MITQLLDAATIDQIGELAYVVSLLATLAIGLRMWRIWRRYDLDIARGMAGLCLVFALFWLYCLLRIHAGCLGGELLIDAWVCNESAWWVRLTMAVSTTLVALWMWRR